MVTDPPQDELRGQIAVVTGSGSGIGRAIALELAAAGADVLIHTGSRHSAAQQVAEEIRRLGRQAKVAVADLAVRDTHGQLVSDAWNWQQGVDIWLNIAGVDVLTREPADATFEAKLEALWQVDVLATIRLSRLIGERMRQRGGKSGSHSIINMGWDQVRFGMAGDSGEMFAAIKGSVMAFTRSLAKTLAPEVRVNCLAPGWIRTAWGEQASEYWQQRAASESLMGRWGTPEDVAHAARFLASPAASFVTGQVLEINGGFGTAD